MAVNRYEQARAEIRRRITEAEQKQDQFSDEAVRCLMGSNVNGYEAASRIGKAQDLVIDWLNLVLEAVDRVESEDKQAEQQEANRRSMLLEGLRADSVEAASLRDMTERVIRNLSWKHPRNGVQLYGAELGRELRRLGVQPESTDREILLAASMTKRDIGQTAYEARELLGGIEGDM